MDISLLDGLKFLQTIDDLVTGIEFMTSPNKLNP